MVYLTMGINGKRHFTYQDLQQTLNFSGAEIGQADNEIGTLVTVTIRMTVDTGGTTFRILLPRINIPGEQMVSVRTIGITTLHRFSIVPASGQRDFFTVTRLSGSASRVFF